MGTRLRNVISDLPKPMAPIAGKPFLRILLDDLIAAGFSSVTLAVGYKHEIIQEYFGDNYRSLRLRYSVERDPLGTGGAIRLALDGTTDSDVFVVNGDTHLELDYEAMRLTHEMSKASLTVAVQTVSDVGRYGSLDIREGRICGFFEKGRTGPGTINGGIYLISRKLFNLYQLPDRFSFETDFLMRNIDALRPLTFPTEGTFIDIGIPEDYARAQKILAPLISRYNDPLG